MFKLLILQIVLIALNAFFAATEIAVVSLNENKIKVRAEDGDKKAKKMLKMIKNPTGFLSTIQVGITLAGFLGSAFAADSFSGPLTDWAMKTFSLSENLTVRLRSYRTLGICAGFAIAILIFALSAKLNKFRFLYLMQNFIFNHA